MFPSLPTIFGIIINNLVKWAIELVVKLHIHLSPNNRILSGTANQPNYCPDLITFTYLAHLLCICSVSSSSKTLNQNCTLFGASVGSKSCSLEESKRVRNLLRVTLPLPFNSLIKKIHSELFSIRLTCNQPTSFFMVVFLFFDLLSSRLNGKCNFITFAHVD